MAEEQQTEKAGFFSGIQRFFKANLIAGILFLTPLVATFLALRVLVNWVDSSLMLLPVQFRPETYLSFKIPGLGFILLFAVLLVTGLLVRNFLGRKLVEIWDFLLSKIPFVSTLYGAVKQLAEAIFSGSSKDFQRVVLLEYPRRGVYTLAFVTGTAAGEIQRRTPKTVTNLFVPTTPNPTSGFYLMVPEEDLIQLDMSVEDAFKVLISGGIVNPENSARKK